MNELPKLPKVYPTITWIPSQFISYPCKASYFLMRVFQNIFITQKITVPETSGDNITFRWRL